MSQSLNCPSCQSLLLLPANQPGRQGLCPRCRQVIQLPGSLAAGADSSPFYLTLIPAQESVDNQSTLAPPMYPPQLYPPANTALPSQLDSSPNLAELYALCKKAFKSDPLTAFHSSHSFEQKGELGKGGMGVIYRVIDKRLGRHAALKVLKTTSPDLEARFLREARITARLDHPSIPPVYEIGKSEHGELYLLMRVIEGKTLQSFIQDYQKSLDPGELRSLMEVLVKVCEAMAYAHSQGILHRDLKPANIMVGAFGEVLVMDWGLAKDRSSESDLKVDKSKELSEELGLTQQGAVLGTLGYMPPEQVEGVGVDEQSDVFALGAILTEILTGRPPIDGTTNINRLNATIKGKIQGPRDRNPAIPKDLDFIALEALSVEKRTRTNSVKTFGAQIKSHFLGEEVPGYHYPFIERGKRFVKKRSGLLLGATIGALLLSLVAASYLSLIAERQRSTLAAIENKKRLDAEKFEREKAVKKAKKTSQELGTAKTEAERAKATLTLFQEARQLLARGANSDKILDKMTEALDSGERTAPQLLAAAKICDEANLNEQQKALLEEIVSRHPPAYEALFNLHLLILKRKNKGFYFTKPLRKLRVLAEERGGQNEFTLYCAASTFAKAGQFKEALALYNKIEVEYTSQFAWMYDGRGLLRTNMGDYDAALKDFNKALSINPYLTSGYYNRGLLQAKMGNREAALRDYDKAISINPIEVDAYLNRGNLRREMEDKDSALKDYNKVISINPKFEKAYLNRGLLRQKIGDKDGALKDFNKAISINPKYAEAYCSRGILQKDAGDKTAAMNDYNRAITINPDFHIAYFNRGVLRAEAGDKKAAIKDYNKAISINPKLANAYLNRANLRVEMGDSSGALEDYSKAISVSPNNAKLYYNRGVLSAQLRNSEAALKDYNKAISITPNDPTIYYNRGLLQATMGDRGAAIWDFTKAISINPKFALAYCNRGFLRNKMGNSVAALNDYNKAISINPNLAIAYANRGYLYIGLGKFELALNDLKKFLSFQPNHPGAPQVRSKIKQLEKKLK